jgi:hypothetical protein
MMLCGMEIILAGVLLAFAGLLLFPWYRLSFHSPLDLSSPLAKAFVSGVLVFLVATISLLSFLRIGVQAIYDGHMLYCYDYYTRIATQDYASQLSDMKGQIVHELWLRFVLLPSPPGSCYAAQAEVCRLADAVGYRRCDPSAVDYTRYTLSVDSMHNDDEQVVIGYLRFFFPLDPSSFQWDINVAVGENAFLAEKPALADQGLSSHSAGFAARFFTERARASVVFTGLGCLKTQTSKRYPSGVA